MTNTLPLLRRIAPAQPAEADADAFARLYQDHTAAVFNYCLYRVGDVQTAEDLTADTFERAWRARQRYNPRRAEFSTWLFVIARRVVADWLRRQRRRPTAVLDERLPSPDPGPEALAGEAHDRHRLHQLVGSLSGDDRELLAYKFGAGMTNRQIARLMGKSETAIGSAVYRVVHRLRLHWEETR